MKRFEYKVNGMTFHSENQIEGVAEILQTAYKGKAIGKNPDEHGYRLNVADSSESFVSGEQVDLEKYSIFRAFPDDGAPFSHGSVEVVDNVSLLCQELVGLGYKPESHECPLTECAGEGVKFEYHIEHGSRAGEKVVLGLVIPQSAGTWPEVTPHWVHVSPPDNVLAEQVRANRGSSSGTVKSYTDKDGISWMALSAPVKDFWDLIDEPNAKNMKTYIERHVRRIWEAR